MNKILEYLGVNFIIRQFKKIILLDAPIDNKVYGRQNYEWVPINDENEFNVMCNTLFFNITPKFQDKMLILS